MQTRPHSIFVTLPRDLITMASAVAVLGWLSALCGSATLQAAEIPKELRVEGPELAVVHATGFQIYTCTPDAKGQLAWTLKAPEATFENSAGLKGKHYAGPTWEAADGSKVVGSKLKAHDSSDPKSVPWLLLEAKSHAGNGQLSKVTFVQRINTTGGKPPEVSKAKAGDQVRVAYTADYVFYGPGATIPAK